MTKAGELSLRFTILDADGNLTTEQGTVPKSDLCKQHDLDPRDLRKLDSLQPNLVPTILSRRSAIIVNMLHVRALIKADMVILFEPAGMRSNKLRDRLLWHMQANIKARRLGEQGKQGVDVGEGFEGGLEGDGRESMLQDGKRLSYEHRVLESILVSVAVALEEEMKYTREVVNDLLADFESDISRDNLRRLLHYSRRIAGFQSRAKYVLGSIEEVLESDEDLSAMYLSAKMAHQPRGLTDHEELELLLESFSKQVEEIVSELDTLTTNMSTTQEVAELILDSNRNALIAMDLRVSIATLGIGVGALASGVFGMNLTSHIESHPLAFYFVTGTAVVAALATTALGLRRLRLLQRVGISAQRKTPAERLGGRIWSRARSQQRENTPSEPVYINKDADSARARDAWRAQQARAATKIAEDKKLIASRFGKGSPVTLSLGRR
ncbi:cora-domain-containing protein [Filobasidium floriforme]|uniref:cora-domain-containing protein n=1 Tax=Filobasidium floriforme TaxID=5210 RepID=UPI001E8CD9F8|nr:cora-domain-containing protein [Filobasidium floriforme]KAH8084261.1 cora-domain-containing protein [Filobasidium floriforme]